MWGRALDAEVRMSSFHLLISVLGHLYVLHAAGVRNRLTKTRSQFSYSAPRTITHNIEANSVSFSSHPFLAFPSS